MLVQTSHPPGNMKSSWRTLHYSPRVTKEVRRSLRPIRTSLNGQTDRCHRSLCGSRLATPKPARPLVILPDDQQLGGVEDRRERATDQANKQNSDEVPN